MMAENAGVTAVFAGDWTSNAQEELSFHQHLVNNDAEAHERGGMVYELDAKRGANARKILDSTGVGSTAIQGQTHVATAMQEVDKKRADDQNSKERDTRDPKAQPAPADDAPLQRFQQGDKVSYWSDTYLQWMSAVVLTVHEGGQVYDLDVKRGAHAKKMKLDTSGTGMANVVNQVEPQMAATPATPQQAQAPSMTTEESQLPRFQKDDKVMYWSDTYNQWMHAVVLAAHEGGQLYDLDVKRGANVRKIKAADAVGVINATPVQAPSTTTPVQQATATTHASRTPAPGPASTPPRGPSPLSGRARATTVAGLNHVPLPPGATVQVADSSERDEQLRPQTVTATRRTSNGNSVGLVNGTRPRTPSSGTLTGISASGTAPASSRPQVSLPLPVRSGTEQPSTAGTPTRSGITAVQSAGSPSPTAAQQTPTKSALRPSLSAASPQSGYTGAAAGARSDGSLVVGMTHPAVASTSVSGVAQTVGSGTPPAGAKSAKFSGGSVIQGFNPPTATQANRPTTLFMGTGTEGRQASMHSGRANVSQRVSMSLGGSKGGISPARSSRWQGLDVGELQIGSEAFNPTSASVRSQLLSKLGMPSGSTIEEMTGFRGGLNEGVWFLSEPLQGAGVPREELVLKLVRCHRIAANILTEAENFLKLFRDHPNVMADKSMAFPVKIFSCLGPGGAKRHDLIVMRKVKGERLAELIARKWYSSQVPQLMQMLEKLGVCLAEFHNRYGSSQHGDFQPSNIFYDEDSDEITLIDVGGMGVPTMENDVEHFSKAMNLLAEAYGFQLAVDGVRHFEKGYNRALEKRP